MLTLDTVDTQVYKLTLTSPADSPSTRRTRPSGASLDARERLNREVSTPPRDCCLGAPAAATYTV